MSHTPLPAAPNHRKGLARLLHPDLLSGPRMRVSAELSGKTASLMILLCVPALLLLAMITIPSLLFPTAQNEAYFYFARCLDQELSRWSILALTAVCSLAALIIPATAPRQLAAAGA
jgi:hypothetical protein